MKKEKTIYLAAAFSVLVVFNVYYNVQVQKTIYEIESVYDQHIELNNQSLKFYSNLVKEKDLKISEVKHDLDEVLQADDILHNSYLDRIASLQTEVNKLSAEIDDLSRGRRLPRMIKAIENRDKDKQGIPIGAKLPLKR
tara:strand:- start:446 stop:862 length:417 start_codon:yes stop_codon:yes gene_type:complete